MRPATGRAARGFALLELALVLIVMGILTAGLAPLLLSRHTQGLEATDRTALADAQSAIVNYALSFGGLPDPLDDAGAPVAGQGVMPPGAGTGAVSAFGVNNWGAHGNRNPFRLDVNDKLRSSFINSTASGTTTPSGGDRATFCQSVNQQLLGPAAGPSVCQDPGTNHLDAASACTTGTPTGFVLFSTGTDRVPNQGNDSASGWFGRVYENDKRGINNSADANRYDDQLVSYPLTSLARDCREKMGVLPEVMACAPGQKALLVNNTAGAARYYTTTLNSAAANVPCTPLLDQAASVPTCQDRTATVNAFSDNACTASAGSTPALGSVANTSGRITAVLKPAAATLY